MEQIERIKESGGWLNRYTHDSGSCNCPMTFSVYLPPQAGAEQWVECVGDGVLIVRIDDQRGVELLGGPGQ